MTMKMINKHFKQQFNRVPVKCGTVYLLFYYCSHLSKNCTTHFEYQSCISLFVKIISVVFYRFSLQLGYIMCQFQLRR